MQILCRLHARPSVGNVRKAQPWSVMPQPSAGNLSCEDIPLQEFSHMLSMRQLGRGVRHMDLGHGLVGWGLNGVTSLASGAGIGYVHSRFRDKWVGKHAPRIAAAGGKLAGIAVQMMTGHDLTAAMFDTVGNMGLGIMGLEFGIAQGRKAAGTQAVLMSASAALPAGATKMAHLGALPPAPAGEGLSWAQLQSLSEMP